MAAKACPTRSELSRNIAPPKSYTPLEFQTVADLVCGLEIPWVRIPEAPRLQGNWGTMGEMSQAQGIRVARVLGIPIYVDFSWILVFGLITFTISGNFAAQHPTWTGTQTWTVGLLTTLLFFSSVVFHELAHSVFAQGYKIKDLSITLFIFGGMARISREPSKAIQEFNIAVAGPLASGFLSVLFYSLTLVFHGNQMVTAGGTFLGLMNLMLAGVCGPFRQR